MNEEARKQRDVVTVRLEQSIDYDDLFPEEEKKELRIKMGISSILGTRKNQQDTVFGDTNETRTLGIVCDGMGGMNGGEIASQTAARILAEDYLKAGNINNIPDFFHKEAIKMNQAVCDLTDENNKPLNGGTTVVAVIVENDFLYWLSIGDSKIYIIRNEEIVAVNREHNYRMSLNEKLKKGLITEEEYKAEEGQAEALISYLGIEKLSLMDINQKPFKLLENDIVLLCSDGLYKRLPDSEIRELISYEEPDMVRAAKRLTDVVMMRTQKSQDNTSVVVMQYGRY